MGWGTGDTEALRPKVNADMIPFMSASYAETLADPKVTPFNFFPGASYSQQMRIALQWISDQNKGKHIEVAVFHHDSAFGTSPLDDGKKYIADHEINNFLKAKNTTAKDKGLHYVQGWYTMATMTQGIDNAIKANGDNPTGEQIKAGLEKISDFKTGVSDPISFSADYHAGLTSAPLYQVTGGAFKKISDPIKVTK